MTDDQEHIIDSFLEEVVGGQHPPDLSSEILRKFQQAPTTPNSPILPTDQLMPGIDQAVQPSVSPGKSHRPVRRLRKQSSWLVYTIVAALAFVALFVGLLASYLKQQDQPAPIVDNNSVDPIKKIKENETKNSTSPQIVENPGKPDKKNDDPGGKKTTQQPEGLVVNQDNIVDSNNSHEPPTGNEDHLSDVKRMTDQELVAAIGSGLNRIWNVNHVSATKSVSETTWAKRVIFALTGREATKQEIQSLNALPKQNRRELFFKGLFDNDQIVDEYSNLWARRLGASFLGEAVSVEHQYANKYPARAHLLAHFRYSLYHNTPYDQATANLLTANGTIQPLDDDYDGASSYLILLRQQSKADVAVATGKIGRSFLGQRMQCAQCHDDQAAGLAQRDFWRMNVLLRDFQVENKNLNLRIVKKPVSQDPVFYEDKTGVVHAERALLPSDGKTSTRQILAENIIRNPLFRQNAVNLVWSELLGYGLVHPPDMGSHNQSVDATLLSQLGDQFAVHDYDIRKLISWIVMSDAFNRQSGKASGDDQPELGQAFFARFYDRQPEQRSTSPAKSLELIAKAILSPETNVNASPRQEVLGKIATGFSDPNKIVQASDADLLGWAVSESYAKTLDMIAQSSMSNQQKVSHLYWLALAREPNRKESETCQKLLTAKPDSQTRILQDIWWAITR